jgi:hypothetical protein
MEKREKEWKENGSEGDGKKRKERKGKRKEWALCEENYSL